MNIVIDNNDFIIENVFFLEKTNNIIIDGFFSKIIVSDEYFTMNGLFLNLSLTIHDNIAINHYNKQIINFDSHTQNNLLLITKISEIENAIIHYYKKLHDSKKKTNLALTTQLYNGYFKIFKENGILYKKSKSNKKYILKISGVWENKEEIGVSYKFIEV
jgi:hypothetical protein